MYNPLKPSWGEPYDEIAGRMVAAIHDARDAARGHEAVIVSHQLPIWTTRLFLEKRSYLHHPKTRQCTLCSLTSVVFDGDRMVQVRYSEPAGDLIPAGDRSAPFSSGGVRAGGPALKLLRTFAALPVALACLLVLVGCSSLSGTGDKGYISGEGVPVEVAAADRGDPVELTGADLDGTDVDLADLRGKPVVVNIWWSECPPCRVEQPDLNEAADRAGRHGHLPRPQHPRLVGGEGPGVHPRPRRPLRLALLTPTGGRCCPSPAPSTRARSRARWCSTPRAGSRRPCRAGSRPPRR